MTSTTQRRAGLRIAAGIASFLLVSLFVVQSSQAAFSATTQNTGNGFEVATIALTDDATTPLFHHADTAETDTSAMMPDETRTACIVIDYAGTASGLLPMEIAATAPTSGAAAGQYLTAAYEIVDDGGNCTVPTAIDDGTWTLAGQLNATATSWTPAGAGDNVSVWFSVTLSDSAPESVMAEKVDGVTLTFSVTTP